MEVVQGGALQPIIVEGQDGPQQTIYHWKGNLLESPIHLEMDKTF